MSKWLVIFAPDGKVIATSGPAPANLLGENISEATDPMIRKSANQLLDTWRSSRPHTSQSARLAHGDETGDLCILEAVRLYREPIDVRSFMESILTPMELQAKSSHAKIELELPEELMPLVYFDSEKIGWIVTTLVGNALRYSKPGNWLSSAKAIHVGVEYDSVDDILTIAVQDHGPGLPEERVSHLFTRKPGATNTGSLALRIAYDFVLAHGGEMSVATSTAEADHGTIFQIRLPNTGNRKL